MKSSLLEAMETQTSNLLGGLHSHAQQHPDKNIQELYLQVQMEAMRMTRKRAPEELTLIEMLNAFDLVVKQNGASSGTAIPEMMSSHSGNEVSSQVYRLILKSERDKAFHSIQDLTEEIKSLKSEIEPPLSRGSRNTAPTQNKLNAQYDQFEFMGSFGHDQLTQKLSQAHEIKTQRVQPHRSQKRSTLPKISLDSVLDMQKNESFVNRCQKLNNLKNRSQSSKRGSNGSYSKSRDSSQKKKKSTSKVGTKQGSQKKSNSPFRSQMTNVNYDLGDIMSPSIISQSGINTVTNRGSANKENRPANSRLPKLNISGLLDECSLEGKSITTMDRAIDSNRNIAFAYYTRRLLLLGWRAFFNYRLEKANKRFYERISSQKMIKNMKRKTLKSLQYYSKTHHGHAADIRKADLMLQNHISKKYLQLWLQAFIESKEEYDKLSSAQEHLTLYRKHSLLRAWRSVTLELQLKSVQEKTAQHIYRQRYLKLALLSLRLVVNVRLDLRRLNDLARQHCAERLVRKSFSAFQIHQYMKVKKQEMCKIANRLYQLNLLKVGIKMLQGFQQIRRQERRMVECAEGYRRTKQIKKSFEVLKAHQMIQSEIKRRNDRVDSVYQKRLKQKLLRFVRSSNKDFRKLENNVLYHMQERQLHSLLTSLHTYAKTKHISTLPNSLVYFYILHYLFFYDHSPLSYQHPTMKLTKRQHYLKLRSQSTERLHQYFMSKVFAAWRKYSDSIINFKQKRTEKGLMGVIRALRSRALMNSKYRYLLRNYLEKRQEDLIFKSFHGLKISFKQRVSERRIINKWRQLSQRRELSRVMVTWAVKYKRQAVKRGQKEVAEEIARKKAIAESFVKWRQRYKEVSQKRRVKERGQEYYQGKFLRKYFTKMQTAFYSLRSLEYLLHQHLLKLRARILKKALCGLLSNVLDNHRRKHLLSQAHSLHSQHLLTRAFRGWSTLRPELKHQNSLYRLITTEHSLKLKARTLHGLKLYLKYRNDKAQTDSLMSQAVQLVTVKKLFRQWQKHLNARVGLKMLENALFEARVRQVFQRLRRKKDFDDSVVRHMTLFNAYKLLDFTFQGLKRKVQLRDRWQACTHLMAERSLFLRKSQYLREWREQRLQDSQERSMTHFSIIAIKNVILRKYFEVLKCKYVRNRSMRGFKAYRAMKIKGGCMQELKAYAERRVRCAKTEQAIAQVKRNEVLKAHIEAWKNELQDHQKISEKLEKYNLSIISEAFDSWMIYHLKCREEQNIIFKVQEVRNALLIKNMFNSIKQYTYDSQVMNQKISQMQERSAQLTLKTYIKALRGYYRTNFTMIQRRLKVKRSQRKRSLHFLWSTWMKQCEDRVTKVRVARCLCMLSKKIDTRFVIGRWIQYANKGMQIEALGEQKYQQRVKALRKAALQKLKRFSEVRFVNRDRFQNIVDYYQKKIQIKFLTALKLSTQLVQRRRVNKLRGFEYRKWHLYKRALLSLVYQVQQAKTMRLLTLALQGQLRKMHAPKVFKCLKFNQLKSKEKKIKTQFADGFTVERIYQRIFKALYWNMIVQKDLKNLNAKAVTYRKGNLSQRGLYSLKIYSQNRILKRTNRGIMTKCIQNFDYKNTLMTAFFGLLKNKCDQQQRFGYIKLQLLLNKMQRFFDILRDYKTMKRSLRARQYHYSASRQHTNMKSLLLIWMRALNIEMKTKLLERQRVIDTKLSVLAAFQRNRHIQQIIRLNLTKRVISYLTIGYKALHNNVLKNKKMRMVQGEITARQLVRFVQKTFMGLRYQCLIEKNLRLMKMKQVSAMLERSFDGWKYQVVLGKIHKSYSEFRFKKELNFFFTHWQNLRAIKVSQRSALSRLLEKKDHELKGASFTLWKRGAYQATFITLLQKNLLIPHQRKLISRCLNSWHRYARLQNRKEDILKYLQNLNASLTARRCLQDWYLASTQEDNGSKLKMRIMLKKLTSVVNAFSIRKSIWKIQDYSERKEYLDGYLNEIGGRKRAQEIHKYFGEWRHRYAVKQMNHVVKEQSKRKLQGFCLTALVAFTQMSKLEKQDFANLVQALRDSTSPRIYFALFQALTPSDDTLIRPDSLLSHYFYRLRASAVQSRIDRGLEYKAVQFNKYKLYLKHFFALMNYASDRIQQNSQRHRAAVFWRYRTQMRVMRAFVVNTLKQRKYRNADAFYNAKICASAYQSLFAYHETQQQKGHLKTKMMRVLKNKCVRIFQHSFAFWRQKYQEKSYKKQAVEEFCRFRNQRQLKVLFNYFAAVCEQQRQIKDMTIRAQNYFKKRRQVKMMYGVLNALQDYAQRQQVQGYLTLYSKQSKESIVDNELQAVRFYAQNLQLTHFLAWKKEIQHNKKRHVRSKLYAIFSAWKFYIKERTLLKMYLKESNIMQDPSLMSTIELKENYARISNPRSIFGESLSSEGLSGTPFRSAAGQQRVFTPLDVNQMQSPQFFSRPQDVTVKMHDDELMQATGQFSSVSSCQTPQLMEGSGTVAAITAKMIMQSSKTNTRYTRL